MKQFISCLLLVFTSINSYAIDDSVIKSSLTEKKIGDAKIQVLRVKSRKIDSPAKDDIENVQKLLDNCYKSLKKEKNISSELGEIKKSIDKIHSVDSEWPVSYYLHEMETLYKISGYGAEVKQAQQEGAKNEVDVEQAVVTQPTDPIDAEAITVEVKASQKSTTQTVEHANQQPKINENEVKLRVNKDDKEAIKSKNDTNTSNITASEKPTKKEKTTFYILLFIILFVLIIIRRFRRRCRSCGKWNAMKTYRKQFDHSEAGPKTKTTTYSYNRKSETINQNVVNYYRHYRKCKHCGREDCVVRRKML